MRSQDDQKNINNKLLQRLSTLYRKMDKELDSRNAGENRNHSKKEDAKGYKNFISDNI